MHLLIVGLVGPEFDGELDELAVLLDEGAQLLRVCQVSGILLQVQRNPRPALEVARIVLPHLSAAADQRSASGQARMQLCILRFQSAPLMGPVEH